MKLFFLCCLMAALPSFFFAQTGTFTLEDNLSTGMSHLFEHVDLSKASTGYLLDHSMQLADVKQFDGSSLGNANLSDLTVFGKVFATMASAKVSPTGTPLSPTSYMDAASVTNSASTNIPVTMLVWNYNYLDENALINNLLYENNGQLYDVQERPESPYLSSTAVVSALLTDAIKNQTVSFSFPSALFFSNLGLNVESFGVDIGNGEVTVAPGQSTSFQFGSSGEFDIAFTAYFSGHVSFKSHAKLKVKLPVQSKFDKESVIIKTIPSSVLHSGIDIEIIYNNRNDCSEFPPCENPDIPCRLIKPLIVIDGIDIDNSRDYTNFLKRIDFQMFGTNTNDPTLEDFFEQAGYDLIFLNYKNGTDDLTRNAVAVEEAIKQINQWKNANGSFEKNVIVGASMGGGSRQTGGTQYGGRKL